MSLVVGLLCTNWPKLHQSCGVTSFFPLIGSGRVEAREQETSEQWWEESPVSRHAASGEIRAPKLHRMFRLEKEPGTRSIRREWMSPPGFSSPLALAISLRIGKCDGSSASTQSCSH